MIDRYAVQIEFPTTADIAAQRKSTTVGDERACFFDPASNCGHALALTGELGTNPLNTWYYQKLHIDFGQEPSMLRPMATASNEDTRKLYTKIGCIMEDASLIALVWRADDETDVAVRIRKISEALEKIGQLLLQIDSAN